MPQDLPRNARLGILRYRTEGLEAPSKFAGHSTESVPELTCMLDVQRHPQALVDRQCFAEHLAGTMHIGLAQDCLRVEAVGVGEAELEAEVAAEADRFFEVLDSSFVLTGGVRGDTDQRLEFDPPRAHGERTACVQLDQGLVVLNPRYIVTWPTAARLSSAKRNASSTLPASSASPAREYGGNAPKPPW
jgi:hypothetical protein